MAEPRVPVRREPPKFRRVVVDAVARVTPRLTRVTFTGPELDGMVVDQPAASVRLLLPSPGADELVVPVWHGNEFLLPDGSRPVIRTFTPLGRTDRSLDIEVVVHGGGAASTWAATVEPGAEAALSGPGRGYQIDPAVTSFVLAGDETATPAIIQLLEQLPPAAAVSVHLEIAEGSAARAVGSHPGASINLYELPLGAPPGDALVRAVAEADIAPDARVWAAGEAAAVQRIRRHLFDERGLARSQATVRGYWKHGRAGADDD